MQNVPERSSAWRSCPSWPAARSCLHLALYACGSSRWWEQWVWWVVAAVWVVAMCCGGQQAGPMKLSLLLATKGGLARGMSSPTKPTCTHPARTACPHPPLLNLLPTQAWYSRAGAPRVRVQCPFGQAGGPARSLLPCCWRPLLQPRWFSAGRGGAGGVGGGGWGARWHGRLRWWRARGAAAAAAVGPAAAAGAAVGGVAAVVPAVPGAGLLAAGWVCTSRPTRMQARRRWRGHARRCGARCARRALRCCCVSLPGSVRAWCAACTPSVARLKLQGSPWGLDLPPKLASDFVHDHWRLPACQLTGPLPCSPPPPPPSPPPPSHPSTTNPHPCTCQVHARMWLPVGGAGPGTGGREGWTGGQQGHQAKKGQPIKLQYQVVVERWVGEGRWGGGGAAGRGGGRVPCSLISLPCAAVRSWHCAPQHPKKESMQSSVHAPTCAQARGEGGGVHALRQAVHGLVPAAPPEHDDAQPSAAGEAAEVGRALRALRDRGPPQRCGMLRAWQGGGRKGCGRSVELLFLRSKACSACWQKAAPGPHLPAPPSPHPPRHLEATQPDAPKPVPLSSFAAPAQPPHQSPPLPPTHPTRHLEAARPDAPKPVPLSSFAAPAERARFTPVPPDGLLVLLLELQQQVRLAAYAAPCGVGGLLLGGRPLDVPAAPSGCLGTPPHPAHCTRLPRARAHLAASMPHCTGTQRL